MGNLERIIKEAENDGVQVEVTNIQNKNPWYNIKCTVESESIVFRIMLEKPSFQLCVFKFGKEPCFKKTCSIAWRIFQTFMEKHQYFLYHADSEILKHIPEERITVYDFVRKHPEMNISRYDISNVARLWVPPSKEGWLKMNFRFYTIAGNVLQTMEQEKELFEYSIIKKGISRFGTFPIRIYCEGKLKDIQIKITEKGYEIEKEKIENNSFKGLIETYVEKVKQEMRLINLYEPPTFFLERMLQNFNRSKAFTKTVYQQLTTWYSNKEIETLAKQYYEENLEQFEPYAYQENKNGKHSCTIKLFSLFHDKELLYIQKKGFTKCHVFIGTKKELKEIYEKEIGSFLEKASLF